MQQKRHYSLFTIPACLFILDRLLKYWTQTQLIKKDWLIFQKQGGLGFSWAKNTGVAFGLPLHGWLLLVVLLIVFVLLIYELVRFWRRKNYLIVLVILLIILGALSNIIDRWLYGYVIDFVQIFWWPVFNLADAMIVVGVIAWIMILLKKKNNNS